MKSLTFPLFLAGMMLCGASFFPVSAATSLEKADDPLSKMKVGRLGIGMEGKALSFDQPETLIEKHLPQADFISKIWKDEKGRPTHQRDLLFVKSGYYWVVIDYLYGTAQHAVARSYHFPTGLAVVSFPWSQYQLADGRNFRIQPLDTDGVITLPAPVTTVITSWSGENAPKIEPMKAVNPMVVKLKVSFPNGRVDDLAFAWESRPLHLDGKELEGWAACVRHDRQKMEFFEVN